MESAIKLTNKIRSGRVCLGTGITFFDPTATEALCTVFDFVWIDMEHNAMSLEAVQAHIMATKATDTAPLVRVAWNDPVLIKPVLDIGAAGVIVPMVHNADEAAHAVAACRYPPDGIRGFGPRRASNYGRVNAPTFCQEANESIITIVQIENMEAVRNLNDILRVPHLTGIAIGPADLSASMGHVGRQDHPDVLRLIDDIIVRCRQSARWVGIASGEDPETMINWIERGVQWACMGNDTSLMLRAADESAGRVRTRLECLQKARSSGVSANPANRADG